MDKSGLMKNLVASSSPGGVAMLHQVSEEAMEVLKKKIGILKHENVESSQRMAAAEKVRIWADTFACGMKTQKEFFGVFEKIRG